MASIAGSDYNQILGSAVQTLLKINSALVGLEAKQAEIVKSQAELVRATRVQAAATLAAAMITPNTSEREAIALTERLFAAAFK